MIIKIPTRRCECGAKMNAGAWGHADGCPRNLTRYWFRLRRFRIRVCDERRWTATKLVMAGGFFYSGLMVNAAAEFDTARYFGGGALMAVGLLFLFACCE